ncbi:XRE family transcriptional regulator [Paenibacillus selenitireducens]|uniref:XRE family transcriptional regulator n=1 Tax=Paenibacillus selenitireducens TaxID=1324314 RepID=A0A1T2XAD1_9BACL|nr:helix-turn-helix transcriptional regulator [Paenibacillus selenitireducens]OPA76772.1 XRE family transcriptional regulator [Paenibacillus selenitireducens]
MTSHAETKRKELGLSQDEVAKRTRISRQYYNAIENKKRKPSVELAKCIASELGVDWTIFFAE